MNQEGRTFLVHGNIVLPLGAGSVRFEQVKTFEQLETHVKDLLARVSNHILIELTDRATRRTIASTNFHLLPSVVRLGVETSHHITDPAKLVDHVMQPGEFLHLISPFKPVATNYYFLHTKVAHSKAFKRAFRTLLYEKHQIVFHNDKDLYYSPKWLMSLVNAVQHVEGMPHTLEEALAFLDVRQTAPRAMDFVHACFYSWNRLQHRPSRPFWYRKFIKTCLSPEEVHAAHMFWKEASAKRKRNDLDKRISRQRFTKRLMGPEDSAPGEGSSPMEGSIP